METLIYVKRNISRIDRKPFAKGSAPLKKRKSRSEIKMVKVKGFVLCAYTNIDINQV